MRRWFACTVTYTECRKGDPTTCTETAEGEEAKDHSPMNVHAPHQLSRALHQLDWDLIATVAEGFQLYRKEVWFASIDRYLSELSSPPGEKNHLEYLN